LLTTRIGRVRRCTLRDDAGLQRIEIVFVFTTQRRASLAQTGERIAAIGDTTAKRKKAASAGVCRNTTTTADFTGCTGVAASTAVLGIVERVGFAPVDRGAIAVQHALTTRDDALAISTTRGPTINLGARADARGDTFGARASVRHDAQVRRVCARRGARFARSTAAGGLPYESSGKMRDQAKLHTGRIDGGNGLEHVWVALIRPEHHGVWFTVVRKAD
jgi:hypothetical protein